MGQILNKVRIFAFAQCTVVLFMVWNWSTMWVQ
jgi:hypothetical protein